MTASSGETPGSGPSGELMRGPERVREIVEGRFERRKEKWLLESLPGAPVESAWPLAISLKPPAERGIAAAFQDFEAWRAIWRESGAHGIVWKTKNLRIGAYKIPASVSLGSAEEAADWIGKGGVWRKVRDRLLELCARRPLLAGPLAKSWRELSSMDDADYGTLSGVIDFLAENPRAGLYPRQLPMAGVHTKWLEARRSLMLRLMRPVLGFGEGVKDLSEALGLLAPPKNIRLKLLDPAFRDLVGGLETLAVPIEEAARLPLRPSAVFIVENSQSGLAFGDLKGSVLIYGHGRDISFLGRLPWLRDASVFYWGDLDTDGLDILSQARAFAPNLRSFFMDKETLLAHRVFWVREPKACAGKAENLTPEEARLLSGLRRGVFGQNVRFEQERINWEVAWPAIKKLAEESLGGRSKAEEGFARESLLGDGSGQAGLDEDSLAEEK